MSIPYLEIMRNHRTTLCSVLEAAKKAEEPYDSANLLWDAVTEGEVIESYVSYYLDDGTAEMKQAWDTWLQETHLIADSLYAMEPAVASDDAGLEDTPSDTAFAEALAKLTDPPELPS